MKAKHYAGLAALALWGVVAAACSRQNTLAIKPGTPPEPELIPAPALEKSIYKKILLLPYEGEIKVAGVKENPIPGKGAGFYTIQIEKALLARGFDVISPEVVARASKSLKGGKDLSTAEKALLLGKETKADAVFMVQTLAVNGTNDFYKVDKIKAEKVEPSLAKPGKRKKRWGKRKRKKWKNDRWFHKETDDCLYRLHYYEVRMEGKLIDARDGDVLWVGDGRSTNLDALDQSWVAKLDKKCRLVEQNFVYREYEAGEPALAQTYSGLLAQMLDPLKTQALKGKKLVREEDRPKKKPPPKPPKKEEPKPKVKTGVVTAKRGSLRAGPGSRNQRIRRLPRKSKFEVVDVMGAWYKVKTSDGSVGWMHESVVIINEN